MFYFAEAVHLWGRLHSRGLTHVHVHFALAAATVAMIVSRLGDVTYSLTIHASTEFFNVEKNLLAQKVAAARFVACISNFCRAQIMCVAPHQDWSKLHVVHCGVDPVDYALVQRRKGGTEGIHILTVGRLIPLKGYTVLMRAMEHLARKGRKVRWTLVGDGPDRAMLEALASQLAIRDRIEFAGAVGQDRVQSYYEQADILALPSYAEGLPVVLMEAMAMQVPVLASRIAGIPELVDDGESGLLLTPGDSVQLALAIERLSEDPDLREQMGQQAQRKVMTAFNVQDSSAQLKELFEACLGNSNEPSEIHHRGR